MKPIVNRNIYVYMLQDVQWCLVAVARLQWLYIFSFRGMSSSGLQKCSVHILNVFQKILRSDFKMIRKDPYKFTIFFCMHALTILFINDTVKEDNRCMENRFLRFVIQFHIGICSGKYFAVVTLDPL